VELVFVRHGQPAWEAGGVSRNDPPLTELGHRQASKAAARLADEHFDEVFVSPMLRARETVAPLLGHLRRDETVVEWLEEIRNNPEWDGAPSETVAEMYDFDRTRPPEDRWLGLPGAESVTDFTARIRDGAQRFLEAHGLHRVPGDLPLWELEDPGRRLGFVCHAGVTSVTIAWLLGMSPVPWEWDRLRIGHASISRVEATKTGSLWTFSLARLSDVEHLAADERTE
jgi:2,3-bisphosphoglycerate-dependent phosphoglycerate mutase